MSVLLGYTPDEHLGRSKVRGARTRHTVVMQIEKALDGLSMLSQELDTLSVTVSTPEFISWQYRTKSALDRSLGTTHPISSRFNGLAWTPLFSDHDRDRQIEFVETRKIAQGLLEAAQHELTVLADQISAADEMGFDSELWAHISAEITAGAWSKVAGQAALFTEDRIRKWAARPLTEVGANLAVAVLGKGGDYKLGRTDSEQQGWQFLGQSIAMAVRNVDLHRIQERPDAQRYAMGVVGACSLLLTQLRYEHGNRFRDTSPAQVVDAAEMPKS